MLEVENLSYWYQNRDDFLFENENLQFEKGKVYAILGQSGSGKTTFLSLLAGLDSPKEGKIKLNGKTIEKIGLTNFRKSKVSTIFQAYNLLPYMTARQNVQTALEISGKNSAKNIEGFFEEAGISKDLIDKPVSRLSGGQQQRVAIVRALATGNEIIIADEPTGNLDEKTTGEIVKIFKKIAHQNDKIVIIVTHEREVAAESDVVFELKKRKFNKVEAIA
jgi:putative ABC transporter, ATP-binding protein